MSKTNGTTAAFHLRCQFAHQILESTEMLSITHLFQLFRLSRRLFVRLLVWFVDLWVHAVHALCPLSIDHSPFLLTGCTKKMTFISVQRKLITASGSSQSRCGRALTFCLGYDLLLCAALSQTCHTVWSLTRTCLPCWWINVKVTMSVNNHCSKKFQS